MKLTASRLAIGGYTAGLVILGIVAALAFGSAWQYSQSVAARARANRRLEALSKFRALLKDAETSQRGYLMTDDPAYKAPYDEKVQQWSDSYAALKTAFDDYPAASSQLEKIEKVAAEKMQELEQTIRLHDAKPEDKAAWVANAKRGQQFMEQLSKGIDALEEQQRQIRASSDEHLARVATWTVSSIAMLCLVAVTFKGVGIWLIQRDLRKRTSMEEEVRQQRVILSAILNSMSEGVAVADERGRMVLFNPAAERILGRGVTDTSSDKWSDAYGVYRTDKTTPLPPRELPIIRALSGETINSVEIYQKLPDQETGRFLECSGGPITDEFGATRGGAVIFRDTTARRAAEKRFQSLLESAPDALIIVDKEGVIRLANVQVEVLFGYSREKLIGEKVELLVPQSLRSGHPAQRETFFALPRVRAMASGLDLHGQHADGHQFPIEISLSPVEGDGEMLVCAAIRDVTERRNAMNKIRELNDELEERVAQRTAELEQVNKSLSERNQENEMFVYSVSHDLRSPLVNLQGFSQELDNACERLRSMSQEAGIPQQTREALHEVLDGDIAESLHFIRTSVIRLSSIIDALLRLSRAGRVVYQWQVVEPEVLVRRVIDAAHGTIRERNAEMVVGELPPIWGDNTAIEQIFGNLIHNALHYLAKDRPGRVEVGVCQNSETPSGFHTYYVRDNGIGIAPDMQVKIFQAFQRLNPKYAPGEGMGLTLVQRIVERHGGRVWVESQPGQGSTFYFTLPSAAARQETTPHLQTAGDRL
jgi:PAS domain S-box-containing protein